MCCPADSSTLLGEPCLQPPWVPPAVPGACRCPRGAAVPLHRAGRKSPSRGRDPESPRQAAVSDCLLLRPPRMEFLVLFLFYLAVVLTSVVLLCVCSKTPRLQGLVRRGAQVFSCVIPERLQRAVQRLLRYLFRTRNYSFLVVHLAVQAMVYTEYTSEIFGYCQELEFPLYYLLQPYLLLAVNLVFFTLTCVTNPGTVTKGNESALLQVYEFDDVMFPKNGRCATCDLKKPARSKHCRVCDCCVHRFDHHCVWVNNCIGAWNARYFLIYLATLVASAASVAAVSTMFLVHLVALSDLQQETYVDDRGHLQAVGVFFLAQRLMNMWVFPLSGCLRIMLRTFTYTFRIFKRARYLFLAFPKIVLLLGFVVVLSILLGGYLCFALYLAVTNQTTFEWFRRDWARRQHCPLVAQPQVYRNIHCHGLWSNLREIFLPVVPDCEGKKK